MTIINKHKVRYSTAVLMWTLFLAFTYLVKYFDVKAIGPSGTMVGFATLNGAVSGIFKYNPVIYKISDLLGYAAILLDAFFAAMALLQWIVRKKLSAIDRNLLHLMFFYAFVLAAYILFLFIVVNYRPVILDKENGLESSYPSSHTMLAIASCYTAVLNFPSIIRKKTVRKSCSAVATVLGLMVILTRILSGVHWLTDIIGAVILAAAMVMLYLASLTAGTTSEEDSSKRYTGKRVAK